MRKLLTTGIALVCTFALVASASALTWTEVGDAGDLPATAQVITGTDPLDSLTTISGSLLELILNDTPTGQSFDADMYMINITDPGIFSATTNLAGVTLDTQLFLFDSTGLGVYAHDETSDTNHQSTLPAGHAFGPQAAGIYYLLITSFDLDPVNAAGLVFPNDPPFDTVYGPTGPGGQLPITGYIGEGTPGLYTIALTGASPVVPAVPEPATLLLLGSGVAGWAWASRNRSRRI
jgi:hypothetical protein